MRPVSRGTQGKAEEVVTSNSRAEAIRHQIELLFIDGGFRGYEEAAARLMPPNLPPPPST